MAATDGGAAPEDAAIATLSSPCPWDDLPIELLEIILRFSPPATVATCRLLSRRWRALASSDTVWLPKLIRRYSSGRLHRAWPFVQEHLAKGLTALHLYSHLRTVVYSWGQDGGPDSWHTTAGPHDEYLNYGALGQGLGVCDPGTPFPVGLVQWPFATHVASVSAGGHHAALVTEDGHCFTWGSGAFYQTGLGTRDPQGERMAFLCMPVHGYGHCCYRQCA